MHPTVLCAKGKCHLVSIMLSKFASSFKSNILHWSIVYLTPRIFSYRFEGLFVLRIHVDYISKDIYHFLPLGHICAIFIFHNKKCILVLQISSEGVFEIQLINFNNEFGYTHDGNCCAGVRQTNGYCTSPCRTFFRICLKQYQSTINPDPPCTFGHSLSPYLGGNSFDVPTDNPAFSNPVPFKFGFSWPVSTAAAVDAAVAYVFVFCHVIATQKEFVDLLLSKLTTAQTNLSEKYA